MKNRHLCPRFLEEGQIEGALLFRKQSPAITAPLHLHQVVRMYCPSPASSPVSSAYSTPCSSSLLHPTKYPIHQMATLPPESPPPSPSTGAVSAGGLSMPISIGASDSQCVCGAVASSLSVNQVADTLGVSPLYKQQDSARWTAARQQYLSSSCHSPTNEPVFSFPEIPEAQSRPTRTPLSLEEIAARNRKRHEQEGGMIGGGPGGPLELEAIAAVHELGLEVLDMHVSEMLPRTPDLIFVNVKTQNGKPFTLELTMKGWRIASTNTDCMNGDYTQLALHTRYYRNARQLLDVISPDHTTRFNECVAKKLELLVTNG